MFFSVIFRGVKGRSSSLRDAVCVALSCAVPPAIASGAGCGKFRGEPERIIDDGNGNVVVGGSWLQLVNGEWIERSRECASERLSPGEVASGTDEEIGFYAVCGS